MTDRLKALVIGGSGALGSEICRVLAGKGFDVVFTYHLGEERANGLSTILEEREGMGCALRLDLNHIEAARATVAEANEKLGGMDALVIASGLAIGEKGRRRPPKFLEITPEGYDRMSDVNVRGVLFVCQEAARIMAAAGGGKIVIVGSIDGVKSVPGPVDYACCKGALRGMTWAMAKELGKYNILVNMVAPGILEGGVAEYLSEELMTEYVKHCALKRVGSFSEAARVVAFLAGEKNTYLTGEAVMLDGGL